MGIPWQVAVLVGSAGAHALAAAVLLLLAPADRSVRWFATFLATLALWFFLRGTGAVESTAGAPWHMLLLERTLPPLFAAFALAKVHHLRTARVLLLIVAHVGVQSATGDAWLSEGIRLVTWFGAAILLWRDRPRSTSREGRALHLILAVFAPVLIVAMLLLGPAGYDTLLPLATLGIVLVVFVGIVRHRLYQIEVRVARSGTLLTQAAAHDRLALLGELAASFAHEVRNPLTGVRSLAQRLEQEDLDDARRRRYAGVIVQEVQRVEGLVQRLLDLARRRKVTNGQPVSVMLAPLLADLLVLLEPSAADADVRLEADAGNLAVLGSRDALAQVLLNLTLNAIAHSPVGGAVHIEARTRGGDVELLVTDEGPGLSPSQRERLFEPFESGADGAGLGLAVSRRLVEEMGGTIALLDASCGSRFAVRLPRARTAGLTDATPRGSQPAVDPVPSAGAP